MQIKKKVTAFTVAAALVVTNMAGVCPALSNLTGMSNSVISAKAALVTVCFPVNNGVKIAYAYGYSGAYGRDFHGGIDIHADSRINDTTVYSAVEGTVYKIYNNCPHFNKSAYGCAHNNTWGNSVIVKGSRDGYFYIYGHLTQNSMKVTEGQKVAAGQALAVIGSSGASTGPHLHFEVRTRWGDGSSTINVNKGQYFDYVNGPYNTNIKTVPDPTDELFDGGIYVMHPKDNKTTAVAAVGTEKNSNVELAALNNNDRFQQWRAVRKGNYYYFVNVGSEMCLDVAAQNAGSVSDGTNIHIYPKSDVLDEVQLYAAKREENNGDSYYTLTLYNTNYSINVYGNGSAAGKNITTWAKTDELTQQWVLKNVGCAVHEWVETESVDSTCHTEGHILYTCKNCGETETETLPRLGHDWEEERIEPTCEEDGSIIYTCKNGGETVIEVLPKRGHDWEVDVIEPTTEDEGYTLHTCKNCNQSYISDVIPPIPVLDPVINIESVPVEKSVTLNWNKVEGAEGYGVYGYIDDIWQPLPLGKTNDTTYVYNGLENGKDYTVAVIAKINGNWNMDFSNAVTVTPMQPYPVVLSYEVSGRQLRLKWTAVSGAEKYGIAVYQSGGWKVKVQTDKTTYTSPKMSKGNRIQ